MDLINSICSQTQTKYVKEEKGCQRDERDRETKSEGESEGERLDSKREGDNADTNRGVERADTVSGGEAVGRGERERERVT